MPIPPRRTLESLKSQYESDASRYIEIDGVRVHYRREGEGPPLVLLHGVMASLHTWDGWVEVLKDRYTIYRVDLPGFGFSDDLPADSYHPEASAQFFERVVLAMGVERFLLAGNSLGGFLGWYYAGHYPHRVEKLALLSPIAFPQRLPGIINLVSTPGIGEIAQLLTPRFLVERNVRQVFGDPSKVTDALVDRYHDLLQPRDKRRAMVRTFRALKSFAKDPTIAGKVSMVETPTLLQWGTEDRWVPISLLDQWRAHISHAQVRIYDGLGHTPMEEAPLQTAEDAHDFFTGKLSTP